MRGALHFFLCFRSELATDEVVLHGTIRLDSKIRSQNVQFHGSFWREQTLAAAKLLTRIDFAVLVSSRAVRISSRAVRVLPALSLRRVRPSYGIFSLMVFQGNCVRGRTGHMIKIIITPCLFTLKEHCFIFNNISLSTKIKHLHLIRCEVTSPSQDCVLVLYSTWDRVVVGLTKV